jgi:type IV conjugative transfer system protein TraE
MNESNYYKEKIKNIINIGANRLITMLALVVAIFVCVDRYRHGNEIQTILTPPEITRPMWVNNNGKASREYYEDMGVFIIQLVMNATPASVDYQSKMLKGYVCADGFGAIDTLIRNNSDRLKRDSVTTVFNTSSVLADPIKSRVTLTGNLAVFIADKRVSNDNKIFVLDFGNLSTKLCIKALYEQKSSQTPATANGGSAVDNRNSTTNSGVGSNQ